MGLISVLSLVRCVCLGSFLVQQAGGSHCRYVLKQLTSSGNEAIKGGSLTMLI